MTDSAPGTKRLHITPFNLELLPSVLPPTIRPLATEISFHCVPTFPENNYGYVTLPTMEAEKVKKKLNGSILKGRKFKVDTARSPKRQRSEDEALDKITQSPSDKKAKKRKAAEETLEGYELPADRKVKRGWTESADAKQDRRKEEKRNKKSKDAKEGKPAKSQAKSKYTEKEECLFRTKLPPNRMSSPDEKHEKQSKKKKPAHETIVHEFSKTVKHPSFLRSGRDESADTVTFVEGKGWMDTSGTVKEPVSDRIRTDQYRPGCIPGTKEKPRAIKKDSTTVPGKPRTKQTITTKEAESTDESEDWTSSSGGSSSEEDPSSEEDSQESESYESCSSSSSNDSEDLSIAEEQILKSSKQESVAESHSSGLQSLPSGNNDQTAPTQEVHPLEALFKRPAPSTSAINSISQEKLHFSFFGGDDEVEMEDATEAQPAAPLTPFTKRDLRDRELRSAAPTPDTALVNRTINWDKPEQPRVMDSDDDVYMTTPVSKAASGPKDDSDFVKWFWENRGDNNRAWKRRRREAAKDHRQRENRSKGMKGKS
ncbi:uncharacterized protein BO95DRAFT_441617 [Aspergillus brunneoviolaceus CBS 621.78]|uniref:Uncharacterized protein n=1 Tax=Aspergillus brunneoviolaceus CBS 621.78 TaxID=1450534 RepID=A0ACD1GCV4_9EURO|nr:hypothetical protein BO95DRAFT_441617 [Aspergillus brunneoviolaceus CBS 621.78]RAH46954.1 hypothetical protein BO95DRAFT_441617 [Aspergillus brunneoviolaceus CBS 621.78]